MTDANAIRFNIAFILWCALFLVLGFGIAALMKVAQGSGTVSMITTSAMIAAMLAPAGGSPVTLPFHAVYLATAIGAGSLVGSWMNDSGFWVVCKTSGLSERETLRGLSVMFSVMGLTGFAVTAVYGVLSAVSSPANVSRIEPSAMR